MGAATIIHSRFSVLTVFLAWVVTVCCSINTAQGQAQDWRDHWAIPPGYFLEVDTSGYQLPVSIAMVPNPGSAPDAPLYYVAELGGRILVVRNDRKVEVFTDNFFTLRSTAQLPSIAGVIGLTGLCLDADTGFLFATYVHDNDSGRFNGITRFSTTPGTFSLRPEEAFPIHKPFTLGDSAFTRFPFGHQIGQCQIVDNHLYVGIGDGELAHRPRSDQSSFGKILRMRFDGSPIAGLEPAQEASLADYIFASGLRNPFGQTRMGENILVADNGPGVDRVLITKEGKDYLYDGSDQSISINAMVLFAPAKGTAHIAYYPENSPSNIDDLKDSVLVVLSGVPETYTEDEPAEIAAFTVEPDSGLVTSRPRSLVKFMGSSLQVLSSIALGADGIYFAPVYGEKSLPQDSNVYRLSWAPQKSYPNPIRRYTNARAILLNNGCRGCHNIKGRGGNIGPILSPEDIRGRNLARLNSPEFELLMREMNAKDPRKEVVAARNRILRLQGEKRLVAWLEEKILEPSLDNEHSMMPLLSLETKEAKLVTRYLLSPKK
jgi:hypothetical protein